MRLSGTGICSGVISKKAASELKLVDSAPAFELLDQYSQSHKLSDYRGQCLVLYFYPRDDTPGCTTEACEFRDDARGEVARHYGSLTSLGPLTLAKRHMFVNDPDSRIAKVYRNVQPKTHSDQVVADLEALRNQKDWSVCSTACTVSET